MDTPNARIANTDLWSVYIQDAWTPWVGRNAAQALAQTFSDALSWTLGPWVDALFGENAAQVTNALATSRPVEPAPDLPAAPAPAPVADPDFVPPWMTREPAYVRRERPRVREAVPA